MRYTVYFENGFVASGLTQDEAWKLAMHADSRGVCGSSGVGLTLGTSHDAAT